MTALVHLTDDDYTDALELLSFNTLDNCGSEVIVDLDETEAQTLRTEGAVDTWCAHSGREMRLIAPWYDPAD
jgi:hypothetical protein